MPSKRKLSRGNVSDSESVYDSYTSSNSESDSEHDLIINRKRGERANSRRPVYYPSSSTHEQQSQSYDVHITPVRGETVANTVRSCGLFC